MQEIYYSCFISEDRIDGVYDDDYAKKLLVNHIVEKSHISILPVHEALRKPSSCGNTIGFPSLDVIFLSNA